jgi:hypothetical protein
MIRKDNALVEPYSNPRLPTVPNPFRPDLPRRETHPESVPRGFEGIPFLFFSDKPLRVGV